MDTIRIEYFNETYIRVSSADASIEQELKDYFSFEVESSQYMKRKNPRLKYWDSKIYLYNRMSKFIYKGLLLRILEFADKRGYAVEYINDDDNDFHLDDAEISEFVGDTKINIRGEMVYLTDYQQTAASFAIKNHRALLLSPTSSGKSAIIHTLIRWHLQFDRKVLLVVPSTLLVDQMYSDFNDYEAGFSDENCQKLYGGKSKRVDRNVLITTWQSIFTQSPEYLSQFDVVIGDEAHGLTSKEVSKFLDNMTQCKFRIGTTGTTNGSKIHQLQLEGIFGRLLKVTTTNELMQRGVVSDMEIEMVLFEHSPLVCAKYKKSDYLEEVKYIASIDARNKYIADIIKNKTTTGTTLVLFNLTEHGRLIYDSLNDVPNVFYIDGSVATEDRELIRTGVNQIEKSVVIASSGTMKQGVSIPSIDTIILVTPTKARITILQSLGRGLRLKDGKSKCMVYDLADDFDKRCFSKGHAKQRARMYKSEKFKVNLRKVKL